MSYKALYRTYRPNSFESVIGQQHIVKTLQNAIAQGKISHAYLFCGPRGTGKTTVAKLVAKSVNCLNTDEAPCNHCEFCESIQMGIHPDVIEIDAASNNGVDEIRDLIEKVKYAPLQAKYKVYIIDEVHMLSQGAFNALLKTLEEPPSHVIFILATTEPHKVIPTIISRCQRYDFVRVNMKEIQHLIEGVLKKEDITYEEEAVRLISQLADGGVRDALSILEQCIAYAQDDLRAVHVNEIYGIATTQDKLKLINAIFDENVATLMGEIENILQKNIDIKRLTSDLMEILKEAVIFHYTKDDSLINKLNRTEAEVFLRINPRVLLGMIDELMDTAEKYRSAANLVSYFEVGMLKLMNHVDSKNTTNVQINPVSNQKVENKKQVEVKVDTNAKVTKPPIIEERVVDVNPSLTFDEPKTIEVKKTQEPVETVQGDLEDTNENIIQSPKEIFDGLTPSVMDFDLLLRLCVSNNKEKRDFADSRWSQIENYMLDLVWARYATMLRGSRIMATNEAYILVSVPYTGSASEVNSPDNELMLARFINTLLGNSHKVFAVTEDERTRLLQEFREKKNAGTLPEEIIVKAPYIETKTTEIKPSEKEIPPALQSLFEGNIDLFDEEKK